MVLLVSRVILHTERETRKSRDMDWVQGSLSLTFPWALAEYYRQSSATVLTVAR